LTVAQSSAHTPAQHVSPPAQVPVRSQRPATHVAVSQPAATHVDALQGGKQPVVRSAVGSRGAHALSAQRVSSGVWTQMRSTLHVSAVQATPSSQSEGALQPSNRSLVSPASRPMASGAEASMPPASLSRGRATHPSPGTHTRSAGHAPSSPVSRQMPATHDGETHDVVLAQSENARHCGRGHEGSVPSTQLGETQVPATQVSSSPHVTLTQLRLRITLTR
jgi:hypothetical protein